MKYRVREKSPPGKILKLLLKSVKHNLCGIFKGWISLKILKKSSQSLDVESLDQYLNNQHDSTFHHTFQLIAAGFN